MSEEWAEVCKVLSDSLLKEESFTGPLPTRGQVYEKWLAERTYDGLEKPLSVQEVVQQVLTEFCRCVEAGRPIPEPIQRFLALSFIFILGGEKPDKALLLKPPANRPKVGRSKTLRDFRLAWKVRSLMNGGKTWDVAVRDVEEEEGVSESTIDRALKDCGELVEQLPPFPARPQKGPTS